MCSDSLTKKGVKITIEGLENMLSDTWNKGVPLNIAHDSHRVIGWNLPSCIYIMSRLSRFMACSHIPEDERENEVVDNLYNQFLQEQHKCTSDSTTLKNLLSPHLSGNEVCIHNECFSIYEKGLAKKIFPKIFDNVDDDGLIPLNLILEYFEPLRHFESSEEGPNGLFKFRESDLILFAHSYFRRSFSRLNNYYSSFLPELLELEDFEVKIALDEDLVGYSPSFKEPLEFDYWRGPRFNDDLQKISPGVTVFEATDYEKFFNGISRSECWFKKDGTFEIEEVREEQSLGIGSNKFGCRYVHAIADLSTNNISHFDGAVRTYDHNEIEYRINKSINQIPRRTQYTKIFRIDGQLDIKEWKTLVSNYFQGNTLIIEYLGNKPLEKEAYIVDEIQEKDIKTSICPCKLNDKKDLRIAISYHPLDEVILDKKRVIHSFMSDEDNNFVIEDDFTEIIKALQRLGDELILPKKIKHIHFNDFYLNLPLIKHGKDDLASNLSNTLEAVLLITSGMERKGLDFVISLNLAWPTETKEIWLSILGYSSDISEWINEFKGSIPLNDDKIGLWLERIGEWIYKNFPNFDDNSTFQEILNPDGILSIPRYRLNPDVYELTAKDGRVEGLLKIPKTEQILKDYLDSGEIEIASGFIIGKSTCSKCGMSYWKCKHSRYLDSGVIQRLEKVNSIIIFLTDKKLG